MNLISLFVSKGIIYYIYNLMLFSLYLTYNSRRRYRDLKLKKSKLSFYNKNLLDNCFLGTSFNDNSLFKFMYLSTKSICSIKCTNIVQKLLQLQKREKSISKNIWFEGTIFIRGHKNFQFWSNCLWTSLKEKMTTNLSKKLLTFYFICGDPRNYHSNNYISKKKHLSNSLVTIPLLYFEICFASGTNITALNYFLNILRKFSLVSTILFSIAIKLQKLLILNSILISLFDSVDVKKILSGRFFFFFLL